MTETIIQVQEIPLKVSNNSILEITSNDVGYFTHSFFKYPCKFIPQIPRWAINKYGQGNAIILDPFAGSGTTLVEAVLQGKRSIGVDFDTLSQLLCKTKVKLLSENQIKDIHDFSKEVFSIKKKKSNFLPDLHNIYHWFPEKNVKDLQHLKKSIEEKYKKNNDQEIYNFLLVAFASIIRKCSFADDTSPKPYVSTRVKKNPLGVAEAFEKTITTYIKNIKSFKVDKLGTAEIISEDARDMSPKRYLGKVDLAITSPPYINAFDYVRSLRLENAWLGFYGDSNITNIKKKQIGTESISVNDYSKNIEGVKIKTLANLIKRIAKVDKKRAYVVYKFFIDMEKNIQQVAKLLKDNGHYIIVVGNSTIRDIPVPTHTILKEIAKMNGFKSHNTFSYIIKNRYLRIPRNGKGGLIKKDWIIDLVKSDG
jgi:DNA modification methylase